MGASTEAGSKHEALAQRIRARIEAAGGWLRFDHFMEAALYEPGLGYYETAQPFGEAGDFVTAAGLGPLLAWALADTVRWAHAALGAPRDWLLVEQGGGDGALLAQLLDALGDDAPPRVVSVERSARQRAAQQARFATAGMPVEVVAAIDDVPVHDAVVWFSNELPDAFPVRCFVRRGAALVERGVGWENEGFVWRDGDAIEPPPTARAHAAAWPDGYLGEWCEGLAPWRTALAGRVQRGVVITIDYGYTAAERYRPTRVGGTLVAHRRHQRSEDVLADPGAQDLTAHVDFTALALAARATGFVPCVFTTQGAWLAQSPSVQQAITRAADERNRALLAAARRLMMPQGMGESFKLLIDLRGLAPARPPFLRMFDRLDRLAPALDG